MRKRRFLFLVAAGLATAAISLGAVACDDDENGEDGDATPPVTEEPADGEATEPPDDGEGATVDVSLLEWEVAPEPTSAPAGDVTFNANNIGGTTHEFVVIRTDLDPAELPTTDTGAVDEEGEGIEVIGEIEELDIGASDSATFSLDAGNYALVCNIVEEEAEGGEVHYQEGMFTSFTVE